MCINCIWYILKLNVLINKVRIKILENICVRVFLFVLVLFWVWVEMVKMVFKLFYFVNSLFSNKLFDS